MKATLWRKGVISVLLVAILLSATACDQVDVTSLLAALLPRILAYKALGTSGNEVLDALLGAKEVLDEIGAADTLPAQGAEMGDVTLVEEAIALRPGDPSYRVQAAGMYVAQGDVEAARQHMADAEAAVPDDPTDKQRHNLQVIDEFEVLKAQGDAQGYTTEAQCRYVHEQLATSLQAQFRLTNPAGSSPAAQQMTQQANTCPQKVKR